MANHAAPLPPTNPGWQNLVNRFFELVMRLPAAAQFFVVLAALCIAGYLLYLKYIPYNSRNSAPIAPASTVGDYSKGGTFDPKAKFDRGGAKNDSANPQNVEAQDKSEEDIAANNWHTENRSSDDPPEEAITDLDNDNYLHYRYYAKTDKCVYVIRVEGGKRYHQWIRDPQYHNHDIHAPSGSLTLSPESMFATLRFAPAGTWTLPVDQLQATPVQSQFCVNPHPGNFTYYWGPPLDPCNSPMYRQFADGCVHYQVYNRCANVWNPQIFWTYCHPPPHN
jgi:hypothetical protein